MRSAYVKKDLHISKEKTRVKRDLNISKEACIYQKRSACVKKYHFVFLRELPCCFELCSLPKATNTCRNRCIYIKRDPCISKETYMYQKRPV